jgi:hypothetical protein
MAATCYDPTRYGYMRTDEACENQLLKAYEQMLTTATATNCIAQNRKEEKNMNIKLLAKKMLNPDLRVLIKAGILNDDLSIRNPNFILEFYVQKHLKDLATEAKARMAELKAEKDEE